MEQEFPRFIARKEFFGCLIYDREIGEYIPFDKDATQIFEESNGMPLPSVYEKFADKITPKSFNTFITLCENIELLDKDKKFLAVFKNLNHDELNLYSPLRLHLQATKECPLECLHCFCEAGKPAKNELTLEEIKKLVDEMDRIGTFEMSIGGGEPFCRDDMLDIIEHVNYRGINLSISTNGLLINKKITQRLSEVKLKEIRVSFDNASQKTYEFLRGKNSYKKALRGIRFLIESHAWPLCLHVTLLKHNLSEIPSLIRLAENLEFDSICFDYALPVGRIDPALVLSYEEANNVRTMAQKLQKYTRLKMTIPSIPFKTQHRGIYHHFGCIAGSQVCYINSEGSIYPCGFFGGQNAKGNIREKSLKELWDGDPLIKLFREFKGNPNCQSCETYISCRGGCRARAFYHTKNLNAPDPYCPYCSKFMK